MRSDFCKKIGASDTKLAPTREALTKKIPRVVTRKPTASPAQRVVVGEEAQSGLSSDVFSVEGLNPRTRKRLVAAASRREGACNRAGEPSVTFCAKEEQRRKCALIFVKNRSKRYKACSDVSKSHENDISGISAVEIELLCQTKI